MTKQTIQLAPNFLFSIVFLFLGAPSEARWLTPTDADAVVESEVIQAQVSEDGQFTFQTQIRIKVLNETSRNRHGTMRFNYSPKNEKFTVTKAETHNGSEILKVDSKDIVDTALSATENGFDEIRQILIPFQEVQIGSVLVYEYKSHLFRPISENNYSGRYSFGNDILQNHLDMTLVSARPLHLEINDPTESLEKIESKNGKGQYTYQFKLKKPLFHKIENEIRSIIPDELLTWVVASTSPSYEDLFAKLAVRYNKMLMSPLPNIFKEVVEKARSEKDSVQQLNLVLALLSEKIRYMGDWRAIDGGYVPRSLETIAATKFGDCKDMSLLTTRILQELGQNAQVALVERGGTPPPAIKVPYFSFNHAIVSVLVGERQLWLDPTNFQSFAQGVPEDLAERNSLILTGAKMEMRKIQFTPPDENTEQLTHKIKFLSEERRADQIDLKINGLYAFKIAGNELRYSLKQIQESTVISMVDRSDLINYKFEKLDLKDRIVKPTHIKVTVNRHYRPAPTSMGPGFTIFPSDLIKDLNSLDLEERASYIYLGPPSISESLGFIENFKVKGSNISNCNVKSSWFDYTNQVMARVKPVKTIERLTVKKFWITLKEMKSPEFIGLKEKLRSCGRNLYLIYSVP